MKQFILTEEEMVKVLNTLAEMPFKLSAGLIQFFQSVPVTEAVEPKVE